MDTIHFSKEELEYCLIAMEKGSMISIPISHEELFVRFLESIHFPFHIIPQLQTDDMVTFRKVLMKKEPLS